MTGIKQVSDGVSNAATLILGFPSISGAPNYQQYTYSGFLKNFNRCYNVNFQLQLSYHDQGCIKCQPLTTLTELKRNF